jgi:hypothetical protein
MERYLIDYTGHDGIYERTSNYFVHLTIRDVISPHATSSPSSVTISITDPCGDGLIADAAMTSAGSGIYTYDYLIASTAPYGKYTVEISTTTYIMSKLYDYYVLPWNCIRDVRRYSGISDKKSISDEDLAGIAWQSYLEVLDEIFEQHFEEEPVSDPDVGVTFNGSNTTVRTRCKNIADMNGDGAVTGYGEQSCGTDITGYWFDVNYGHNLCNITVVSAVSGRITVTQTDGTAIPANNRGVYLTYWTRYRTYNETLFREAVSYLAAHKISKSFNELDKSTLVDIERNKMMFLADPNRLLKIYEGIRDKIRRPMIGGTR